MAIARAKILEIARSLPPGARVLAELDRILVSVDRPVEEVATVIKRDPALAAQLIRRANSVALGGVQPVGAIDEAISRVGFEEVFRILGDATVGCLAEREIKHYSIGADELRAHVLRCAFVCEYLARSAGLDPRRAYTAGLLRALGLLVLDRVADRYGSLEVFQPGRDPDYGVWEGRCFGLSSGEVAAIVLAEWGFPAPVVNAVRNQHLVRSSDLAEPLACVLHLAQAALTEAGFGLPGEARQWDGSLWKLEATGLDEARYRSAIGEGLAAYSAFVARPAQTGRAAQPHSSRESEKKAEPCNFEHPSGVLPPNDAPPVHTTAAGVSPATDFTTFMRNYQDMVFSTAARLTGNDAQAEDISQEVFLKAYENYDHLSTSPTAGGWLKTVATNLSLNHLSRYRNRWRFFSEFKRDDAADDRDAPDVEFAAPDTFFSDVDAEDRRAVIDRALAQLPAHQRVPLVLYHFEDMPYDEIAKKTGVSLAKVKTDILRARAALAKFLGRSGNPYEKISL
jgi:RNA polymerase sigma-70 factor (ECF subfamily)